MNAVLVNTSKDMNSSFSCFPFFYSQRIPSEQPQAIENKILWRTVQGKLYIMLVIWHPAIASHTSKQLPLRPKATVWLWIFKTSKLCTSDGLIPVLSLSSGVDDAHQMLESPLPGIGALEVRFNLKGFFPAMSVQRGKKILQWCRFPRLLQWKVYICC